VSQCRKRACGRQDFRHWRRGLKRLIQVNTRARYCGLLSPRSRKTRCPGTLLRGLGVGSGDRVFSLTGRVPELCAAALSTLRPGSVLARTNERPFFVA